MRECVMPQALLLILVQSFLLAASWFLLVIPCHRAHAECEPVACGSLAVIRYPFWLGAPGQSPPDPACGHPSFELWCNGNGASASASMRGSAINVLRIDYNASSFVASHARIAAGDDGVCRADFNMSSSLALSPFKTSPTNRALCFLRDCVNGTEPTGIGSRYVNATSSCSGGPIYAYLGGSYDRDTPPAIHTGSCRYTYLPVLGTEAEGVTAADYGRLLKSGFMLEWAGTGVGADCPGCVASGGQCRYRSETASFLCLCPGGELRRSTCDSKPANIFTLFFGRNRVLLQGCNLHRRNRVPG